MTEWTNIEPNHRKGQKGFTPKDVKRTRTIALRVTKDQYDLIEDYCRNVQKSKATVLREALVHYFNTKGYNTNVDRAEIDKRQTSIFIQADKE